MKNHSKPSNRGFTLIELLVAMTITTIIVTILVSITALALDTWNRSRSEIRAARQGKAMIDSMARDFESLVVRKGNDFEWLYAAFSPTDSGPRSDANKSPNAADLVFFSAATDRYNGNIGPDFPDSKGDVSTIAYQLAYKDPIESGGSPDPKFETFVLYRKIINPDVTFTATLGTPFDTNAESSDQLRTKAESAASDPSITGDEIDNSSNFICENVYQFTITFHVDVTKDDGTIVSVPVPIGEGNDSTDFFKVVGSGLYMDSTITGDGGNVTNEMLRAGRLSAVEISLTVLTDFGLRQMQQRGNIDNKDEFIAEHSYQYSKLIPVPGS